MAPGPCFFSCWLLVCWLVIMVVKGQEVVTPPGGSQNNVDPTDCQIFTLTPPPITRKPVTRVQPITRTPKCPFHFFPGRWPRVHIRFPKRPFHPPKCNHRFQLHSFFGPHRPFPPHYRYFPRRKHQSGSSSEESREKREAPDIRKQKEADASQKTLKRFVFPD